MTQVDTREETRTVKKLIPVLMAVLLIAVAASAKTAEEPQHVFYKEIQMPVKDFREEAEYIAKTIWGEARGCSTTEQAAVVWCILNRVDSDDPYYPDDIISVITQQKQFSGYKPDNPVTDDHFELALDVIYLWQKEKSSDGIVAGRVLPREYLWFTGDGKHNYFRDAYEKPYNIWDWSLSSPYEKEEA